MFFQTPITFLTLCCCFFPFRLWTNPETLQKPAEEEKVWEYFHSTLFRLAELVFLPQFPLSFYPYFCNYPLIVLTEEPSQKNRWSSKENPKHTFYHVLQTHWCKYKNFDSDWLLAQDSVKAVMRETCKTSEGSRFWIEFHTADQKVTSGVHYCKPLLCVVTNRDKE